MARAFPSRIVRRSIATMPRRSGSAALSTFRDRRRASRRSRKSRAALRLGLGQMTVTSPNFVLLDSTRPDIANLVTAMLQARDAVGRRSWSHPQQPTGEEWWADVLADPRARKRERRTDLAIKLAFYLLADEKREIILVACSKCEWRAAVLRGGPIGSPGGGQAEPQPLQQPAPPPCRQLRPP